MSTEGLNQFKMDLTKFRDEIMPNNHAAFCKMIAMTIDRGVVLKTPVKTGLARGNWQVTEGAPATQPIKRLDPSGEKAIKEGSGVIRTWNVRSKVLWITNMVPYAEKLENGHSKQAPNGMVELTLNEIKEAAHVV